MKFMYKLNALFTLTTAKEEEYNMDSIGNFFKKVKIRPFICFVNSR